MTCNISATPLDVEPLPVYQREPETSSLLSSAPSYISEAPTYHSSVRDTQQQDHQQPQLYYISTSLLEISTPPPRSSRTNPTPPPSDEYRLPSSDSYAPGFTSRTTFPPAVEALYNNYNISAWSNISSSHTRRQYERVAMRRASRAPRVDRANALLESMRLGEEHPFPSSSNGNRSPVGQVSSARTPPPLNESVKACERADRNVSGDADLPLLPHEDPALVGDEAAALARQQRLYREACLRHDRNVRLLEESKSWDFMLSQIADWEERERSWGRFRSEVEARQGQIEAMGVGIGRLGGFAIGDGGRGGNRGWSWGRGKLGS